MAFSALPAQNRVQPYHDIKNNVSDEQSPLCFFGQCDCSANHFKLHYQIEFVWQRRTFGDGVRLSSECGGGLNCETGRPIVYHQENRHWD